MRKMNKTAFTLVELIVVITILAILATVAFISFGGQTGKAKNAKVTSDVSSLASKVNVMTLNAGKTVKDFVTSTGTTNTVSGTGAGIAITTAGNPGTYEVGNIDFFKLQEKQENFQDTTDKANPKEYIYGYVSNSSTAVFNIAGQTTNADGSYTAVIKGSYFKAGSNDQESLISSIGSSIGLANGSGATLY